MTTNPDSLSPEAVVAVKRGCEDSTAGRVTEADFSQYAHPDVLEHGMLFRLTTTGDTYMVIDTCAGTRLVQVHGSKVGSIKSVTSTWGTDPASSYEYLGTDDLASGTLGQPGRSGVTMRDPRNKHYGYAERVTVTLEIEIAYDNPKARDDAVKAALTAGEWTACGGGGKNGCYSAVIVGEVKMQSDQLRSGPCLRKKKQ